MITMIILITMITMIMIITMINDNDSKNNEWNTKFQEMNPFYKIILNNNDENNDTSVLGDLLCRELGFLGSVSTAHGSSDFATVPMDVKE